MRVEDLPRMRGWLLEPHVARWWHDDPAEHDYPDGTLRDWTRSIRGEDATEMHVIVMDGRPIGMIQSYVVQDEPDYVTQAGELADRALGVDLFIGVPGLIGQGHGPALLRAFLREAFARYGLDYCVIGPSRSNVAAIRSYEKAGFRYLRDYREDDTIDPPHVLLDMRAGDLR